MGETEVIVLERGSGWPARVHSCGLDLVALRQENDEHGDAFLVRVFTRLCAIHAKDGRIRRAALSCNADSSRDSLERRTLLARILLAALDADARLLVVGQTRASDAVVT